uniref:2-oxoglutarate dehydrogenase, mitochondrial n=1 Tax=Romanomermis culicivorax TaxID=13658 RepID=A0A915K8S1_ROMCU
MLPKTTLLNRTIATLSTWRSTPSTIPFCRAFNARKSPQIGSVDEESSATRAVSKTQLRKLPPPLENATGSGASTISQTRNAIQQRQQSTGTRMKDIFKSELTAEPFLTGTSSNYIEDMYVLWKMNPHNVHKSWDAYFRRVKAGLKPGEAYNSPFEIVQKSLQSVTPTLVEANLDIATLADHLNVHSIIRSYQNLASYGNLDGSCTTYCLHFKAEKDLERSFMLPRSTYIGGSEQFLTLREILRRLKTVYCGHTGVEYMYMTNSEQLDWLRKRLESPYANEMTPEEKTNLLKRIIRSFEFEDFMAKKYPSEKRFGVEGCEALIPAIKQIIDRATVRGVDSFIIGMPHRGRLNLLANVARRPLESIFAHFNTLEPADEGSGDVKYHLGRQVFNF